MTTKREDNRPAPSVLELFNERRQAQEAGETDKAAEAARRMAETPARCIGEIALKLQALMQASADPLLQSAHSDTFRMDPDTPIPEGKSHPKHHMPESGEPWPHGPGKAEEQDLSVRLLAALQTLPPRTRDAFVLHKFEAWSYSRIAYHLGISEKAVEKAVRDAIYALDKARIEP